MDGGDDRKNKSNGLNEERRRMNALEGKEKKAGK